MKQALVNSSLHQLAIDKRRAHRMKVFIDFIGALPMYLVFGLIVAGVVSFICIVAKQY
jgi:hypothetical protein